MALISHKVLSDIFNLENIVQTTGIMHSKNILIDCLRDIFRRDREYKYVEDVFGFPKTPGLLGFDPSVGLDDDESTRIFIGSTYRYDVKFHPSLIVKNTGLRYVPLSFNQEFLSVLYRKELIMDGYGNKTIISTPGAYVQAGIWDQTFEIKVTAESEVDREEIADIVQTTLMGPRRLELQQAGLFIKTLSSSGEQEEPYTNDYLYSISISLETRSEWKMHIPINNICERIGLCIHFNTINGNSAVDSLAINQIMTQTDELT
jgi:hypothetical protein